MKRGSRIGRVLNFFRNGDKDEITAVFHMLASEGLIPTAPVKAKTRRGRRPRLNGADRTTSTISSKHTDLSQSEAFKSREVGA